MVKDLHDSLKNGLLQMLEAEQQYSGGGQWSFREEDFSFAFERRYKPNPRVGYPNTVVLPPELKVKVLRGADGLEELKIVGFSEGVADKWEEVLPRSRLQLQSLVNAMFHLSGPPPA